MASKTHEVPDGYVKVQDLADRLSVASSRLRGWCRRNHPDQTVSVVRPDGGTALWASPSLAERAVAFYGASSSSVDDDQRRSLLDQPHSAAFEMSQIAEANVDQRSAPLVSADRQSTSVVSVDVAREREDELLEELTELRIENARLASERDARSEEVGRWVREVESVRTTAAEAAARAEVRQEQLVDRVGELERAAGFYAERLDTIIKWAWNVAKTPRWRLLLGRRPEVPEMGYSAIQDLRGGRR